MEIFERFMNGKLWLRNLDKRLYTRSDRLSKFLKGSWKTIMDCREIWRMLRW